MENNIKGEIGKWGLAMCKVIVQNPLTNKFIEVRAVIDTGAYHYCIKQKVIDFLELPKMGEGSVAMPVEGVQKTGIYRANLIFEPDKLISNIYCNVLIVDDYEAEVIIGTFFLQGKSFNYNTLLNSWRIIY